ncbi:hypothetical protein [Actinosynnema pretiosum]|uniref:hypothetical protein n=1 Tax=Actinosynnema pretiosum TaxID=42197 RepID=UPI000B28C854|nr:hypothetical protein [Actinosynnema pretiosum]
MITGRSKEILVTSGGKNVSPAAIEDRIGGHLPVWKRTAGKSAEATVADLAGDPDLLAELQHAVDQGNAAVSRAESVRRFRVLPVEFTRENGCLTPSLEVKRDVVVRRWADEVEACYAG